MGAGRRQEERPRQASLGTTASGVHQGLGFARADPGEACATAWRDAGAPPERDPGKRDLVPCLSPAGSRSQSLQGTALVRGPGLP